MIVATTSFIPNTEISEILDVVHSRVVVGTNVFSDISASFTDFFGGNNSSYEKGLAEITDNAIDGLKKKAAKLKANAIIDLKIDVDEISGKNKSMFMVTAIGTAVRINKSVEHLDVIDRHEMQLKITHNRILKLLSENKLPFLEDWFVDYVTQNRIPEVFGSIVNNYAISNLNENSPNENFIKYVHYLNQSEIIDLIIEYSNKVALKKEHYILFNWIFSVSDFEYEKILLTLQESELKAKKIMLVALRYHKSSYSKKDFRILEDIVEEIKIQFPKKSKIEIGQNILNRGKEYWVCQCGHKNESDNHYLFCQKCDLDEYGNESYVPRIDLLLKYLQEVIECKIT